MQALIYRTVVYNVAIKPLIARKGNLHFVCVLILRNYQTWSCRPQRPKSGASQAQSLTRQNGLATKNSLGSLGLPAFFLLNQTHEVWFSLRNTHAFVLGTSAAHLPWKRLRLTCFTRMKVRETSCTMISGINMVNKNRGLILVSPLSLFKSFGLTAKIRTPPLWENTVYLLTNSPEIRSSHFCVYFIAIAYSRKRTKRFYIINNHSVFSCASTWFTEWLSIMWL